MLKRVFSLFLSALILSAVCSAFSGITAVAETSDAATITFDTDAAISNFYTEGSSDALLSITDEYGYTGKCLKVAIDVPDATAHEARILMDAGKFKLANFNNCTIEAHILFTVKSDKIWGPGTQSVSLMATDPSWTDVKTDSSLYGAWQTITLKCGPNDNNKSFGFYFPIAGGNSGQVICYIDDIRIIKDGAVLSSIDMDSSLTYPLATDTATFATSATTTTPVVIEENGEGIHPVVIILIVSLIIIAGIVGIIFFFVWKSKNKYY